MEKVVVYYHKETDTMDVWFGNPKDERSCEEMGEGVVLKKDAAGQIIGFEKLYVHKSLDKLPSSQPVPFELIVS